MKTTALEYDLSRFKEKQKTYLIRDLFGYTDYSNHGKYQYERPGKLSKYILQKWGKCVIITKDPKPIEHAFKKQRIPYKSKHITLFEEDT